MWTDNEISTRNCYNCIAKGDKVDCQLGHWQKLLTLRYILEKGTIVKECIDCADLDNIWR